MTVTAEATRPDVTRETFCVFELPGAPRAWERAGARIVFKGGRPRIVFYVTPAETQYRESLAWAAKAALRGKPPTELPVAVIIAAYMPIPASWTAAERAKARAGISRPTGKPDADNLAKLVGDSLLEVVWKDDAQIVDLQVSKRFSEKPGLRVEVVELH
jgi:Holliday junction resolvase RusA-like endonuclease